MMMSMSSSKPFMFTITITMFHFLLSFLIITINGVKFPSEMPRIEGAVGPESFDFDTLGDGPYTGISTGQIIKWQEDERRWANFAVTSPIRDLTLTMTMTMNGEGCEGGDGDEVEREHICGRQLGLRFHHATRDLYIADAYMGLLMVGPHGGLATQIATEAEGVPFKFCNSLDIDQSTGAIYFTDSSTQYHRRNYFSAVLSGERTGRLMKYDPNTQKVTVLLRNLSFPNGISLSQDGTYLLLAETISCRILKYWLKTPKAGTLEFLAQLPGFPDNIKLSPRGGFWVGIYSKRQKPSEWATSSYPWIGRLLIKLPGNIAMKVHSRLGKLTGNGGMGLRLSEEDGSVLEVLEDYRILRSVSEVMEEKDGKLWIGSINMPYAGIYKVDI